MRSRRFHIPPAGRGKSSHPSVQPSAGCRVIEQLLRAEREARSESTSIYRRKVSMSGRLAGRPAVVTLFERLFPWNGMTNSRTVILIRCHHPINHVFDRHRYPLVPATARRVSETPSPSVTRRRLARLRSNLVCA